MFWQQTHPMVNKFKLKMSIMQQLLEFAPPLLTSFYLSLPHPTLYTFTKLVIMFGNINSSTISFKLFIEISKISNLFRVWFIVLIRGKKQWFRVNSSTDRAVWEINLTASQILISTKTSFQFDFHRWKHKISQDARRD